MHRAASSAASHLRLSKIAGSKVDSERSGKEQAPDSRTNTIDRPAVDERRERLRPIEFGIAGYGRTRSEASFSASSSPLAQQLQENWVRPPARVPRVADDPTRCGRSGCENWPSKARRE